MENEIPVARRGNAGNTVSFLVPKRPEKKKGCMSADEAEEIFNSKYPYFKQCIDARLCRCISSGGILPGDKEDARQEAFLLLWRRMPKFNPDRNAKIERFAVVVIESAILNFMRHKARFKEMIFRDKPFIDSESQEDAPSAIL